MKKKSKQEKRKIILSQNKPMPMKYKVLKVEQINQIKKKKSDTASTAPQSPKKTDDVAPKAAATVNNNKRRNGKKTSAISSNLNANTTPDGDKYKNVAKMNMLRKPSDAQRNISSATQTNSVIPIANPSQGSIPISVETAKNSEKKEIIQSNASNSAVQKVDYKAKAAEISKKMMADVNKARSQTDAYEKSMKAFAIQQARNEYKKAHVSKETSERFRSAAQKTEQKAVLSDPNYEKYKKQASIHYTKMVRYTRNSNRLNSKITNKEEKAVRNETVLKIVKGTATLVTSPAQFAKDLAEEQLRKSKIADAAFKVGGDIKTLEEASKADSLASGSAAAMTALPEKYVKTTVKNKVTNVLTGRDKVNKLKKKKAKYNKKYGREAHKAERAERKAKQAKMAVQRNAKIKWYKEKKGLSKTGEVVKDIKKAAKKLGLNIVELMIKAAKKGAVAAIAAIGPGFFLLLIILMVISSLFTWLEPHEENFYVEADNAWEPVMVETTDEILKGYIKHIQDYFDKKQLEILEVIDINFDGFTPDKYDYAKMEDKGGVLNFEDTPKLTTEYTTYYVKKTVEYDEIIGTNPGSRDNPSGTPIWSGKKTITGSSGALMRTEYYKYDYDLGYEQRTTSLDYDYTRTYLLCAIDIEAYLNSLPEEESGGKLGNTDDGPIYSCNNGKFSVEQDITDEKITVLKKGAVIYDGTVLNYIMQTPKIFEHTVSLVAGTGPSIKIYGSSIKWEHKTETEIISDEQYIFTNYIWNLYEYGNQWIKLSDDCDFEHIIAMAAIKKWQEIEADGFDANTYAFEITDDDLDYCLDNLYEFYYSYRSGRCRNDNCHKYITGDPPKIQYTCNRATTHKHLIGQVTNYELIGGVDFALNKILKIPKRSDYSSDEEYNKAKEQFETDKEIYEVYAEYISDELGTSTKLPDYENDRDAQYRLLRMHQASYGKRPSNPPQNVKITSHKKQAAPITPSQAATSPRAKTWEHYYISIQWEAPDTEYVSKDEAVVITNYDIYEVNRSTGKRRLLARVGSDQTSIADLDIGSGKFKDQIGDAVVVEEQQVSIVMQSVNEQGASRDSKVATYWLK